MAEILFKNKIIFYRAEGIGKAVMLLHGFGEDGDIWEPQLEYLKTSYRVIVPDLPGSGRSQMLEGPCSLEDYAEVIKAIAEKELEIISQNNPASFTLIGHSMGGYITLAFAKKYPDLLNSFGLFHSSAYADDEEKIETRKKAIAFIKKNGAEAFLQTAVPDLFAKTTQNERPELIEKLLALANRISGEALIQYYEAMMQRPDTTDVLRGFLKPVLFLISKQDPVIPLQASLEQSHLPSVSSIHILQHSGHVGMWEEESLSNTYVANFLHAFA